MKFALALVLALLALPAFAHDYTLGSLHIGHVWAGTTTPKATIGAAYMPIENKGTEDDVLKSATTDAAEKVEFHQTKIEDGIAKMREVNEAALPAGKTVEFKPGGFHLMLVGLKKQLKEGDHVMITLHFAKAGKIEVDAHVQKGEIKEDHSGHTAAPTHDHGDGHEHSH